MINQFYTVQRRNIAVIQFIIEGYDGMATVSTLDPHKGIIQVSVMKNFLQDIMPVIEDLKKKYEMREIDHYSVNK